MNDLREQLAALAHEQWVSRARPFVELVQEEWGDNEDEVHELDTPYAELTEKEKDSDREWADKVLVLVKSETAVSGGKEEG